MCVHVCVCVCVCVCVNTRFLKSTHSELDYQSKVQFLIKIIVKDSKCQHANLPTCLQVPCIGFTCVNVWHTLHMF